VVVVLVAVPVLLVAVAVALVVQRRTTVDAPTQPTQYPVPSQLDRADFDRPGAPWLVAVFSSDTCSSCAGTLEKAEALSSHDVAVQEVSVQARADLHDRYRIEAVPMLLVADRDGVVCASFVGLPTAADLWAAVAELREPGSVPEGCDHHGSAPPA
jgi:hypothetical protein